MRRQLNKENTMFFFVKLMIALIIFCVLFTPTISKAVSVGESKTFGATSGIQAYPIPATGYYKLEVWGAQGGSSPTFAGGYGSYATGVTYLEKGQILFVVVGGQGGASSNKSVSGTGGYNGGGAGGTGRDYYGGSGGGGATHIATTTGLLSTLSADRDKILIVAGGGGGAGGHEKTGYKGGNAGGYTGVTGNSYRASTANATGGTQTSGYSFGLGQRGRNGSGTYGESGAGGGGGGFYGGKASQTAAYGAAGGGGGSGYIGNPLLLSRNDVTKAMYCYSCSASSAAETRTISNTAVSASAVANTSKTGSGAAKITLLELTNDNAKLASVTIDGVNFTPKFDPETYEYYAVVDSEKDEIDISATAEEIETIIDGTGKKTLQKDTNDIIITGTAESGDVATYVFHITRPASSYRYLKDIKINNATITGFNPSTLTYNLTVPYNMDELDLNAVPGRVSQQIHMPTDLTLQSGANRKEIVVVSEDGVYTTSYILNITREHSSKLKSIDFADYGLNETFNPETLEYTLDVMSSTLALKVNAIPYDEEATVTLNGFGYIKSTQTATITVTEPNSAPTVYKITINKGDANQVLEYTFPYSGSTKTFKAPVTGYYRLEAWGAQGGKVPSYAGGYGAYSTGVVYLKRDDVLYITTGGKGGDSLKSSTAGAKGYNGGGQGGTGNPYYGGGGGGGATHIATSEGLLSTLADNQENVILVAGGGGGAAGHLGTGYKGGNGGGYVGVTGNSYRAATSNVSGGSQTSGYAFGLGGNGRNGYSSDTFGESGAGGGGGGFYGGRASLVRKYGAAGGGGGSGYIANEKLISYGDVTKVMYCYSCSQSNAETTYTVSTTKASATPTSYYAKSGDGYAKITLMAQPSENNFLSSITVKATHFINGQTKVKDYTPPFNLETGDYYVNLDVLETSITLIARPEDSKAKISGLGTFDVPAGTTDFEIVVTSEAGTPKTYTVHVTRPASSDQYPLDIIISGLVPSLCAFGDGSIEYCSLNPDKFDKDTKTYYLTVPYRIKQLYFDVHKGHPFQTVTGEGKVTLNGGENIITIEVESEDGTNTVVYTYYVTRDMTGNTDIELEILDPERDINFDPDISEYYLTVDNSYTNYQYVDGNLDDNKGKIPSTFLDTTLALAKETIQLYIRTDDENASFTIDGPESLNTGMNDVNIIVTSANGEIRYYVLHVYRLKNENVFLSNLEVSNGTTIYPLSPEFDKVNLGPYQVVVPNNVTSVTITAPTEASTSNVDGDGDKTLSVGINKFKITVTAENGTVETYSLNITREKNSNANLTDITVKNGDETYNLTPIFSENTLEYNVDVPEGVSSVVITATPEVNTTTYKLLDNNTIKVGKNVKRVKAIAEDGTSKTYTININRPASSNNNLTELKVSHKGKDLIYTPPFAEDTLNYTLEVENEISYVDVTATKADNLAKISGVGKYNLIVGENTISVIVTSETNEMKTYVITITRKPNSNPYLLGLTPSSGILSPGFVKTDLEYTINVPNEIEEINLNATPEASSTSVTGAGKHALNLGDNTFEIVTRAEDGIATLTYKVKVIRDKSLNNNLSYLIMEEGSLSPKFNPNIVNYSVTVPYEVTKGTFHVGLADPTATYEIINNENFVVGEQDVIIRVTSDKDKGTDVYKDYVVKVTRQEYEEASNYLSSLTVSSGTLTPDFDKTKQYYTVNVPYETSKVNVNATAEESTATITGRGEYSLNEGRNLVTITVASKNGTTRDYQVSIERAPSNEARLSSIVINGSAISPTFDRDTYNYTTSTTAAILEFSQITTVDPNAFYEIDGLVLTTGETNIVTIKVTAPDMTTTKTYTIEVEKLPSNNNNLAYLEVENYNITPEFSSTTTLYRLNIPNDVSTINIIAYAEDPGATITGDGLQPVNVGENQFVVQVTSEAGSAKSYIIIVNKEGSNNNNVANLEVLNGTMTPAFNGGTSYDVLVPYEEDSLDLRVILEDNKASYTVSGNDLKVGSNTVTVIVTAENGDVKNYTLNVTREEIISALLENIIAKNYNLNPEFNSYINTYNIVVNYETEILDLTIIPLDKHATYTISGNGSFAVGLNTITIDVTSSDGNKTEQYILNVTRQPYANTFLDYLYTDQGDLTPVFNKETLKYSIDVPYDTTEIELIGEAVDKSTTVTGLGLHSLNTGENVIPVQVTAKNGTYRIYYVTVNRSKNDDNFLETLTARVGGTYYSLNPEFESTTTEYSLTVPVGTPSININGTLSSDTATVTGLGMYSLKAGTNIIEVVVTSESGKTRTYTITVTREANNNNMLIDLIPSVGTLEPSFGYFDTNYTLNLDSSAALLSFDVVTEDANAKVEGIESKVVPDGTSTRTITVTAENGDERVYTITINKERTDNAMLANLYVVDYPFAEGVFVPNEFEYHITVPNLKNIILSSEVIATPEDPNAKITKSGNVTLLTSTNIEYIVTITAPDGFTKQNYKIIIEREKSNNNLLSLLSVKVGNLEESFYPDNFEYTWVVPKKTVLTPESVLAIAQDPGAIIEKTASITVTADSTDKYIVKVTAEDGSSSTEYILNIVPDLSTDATLASLEIDQGMYTPKFNENIFEYDAYVYVDTTSITVTATPSSTDSDVTSGNGLVELPDTHTYHEIIVTAEDGTTETYILNIHRTVPRDEGLRDLHLFGLDDYGECNLDPHFATDIENYKIKVPHEYENLKFIYEKMNPYQTVKFKLGENYFTEYNLPVGVITVQVEVYDGLGKHTKTYTVEIERSRSNNNYLKSLSVDGYNLDPAFNKYIQEYTINVETDIDEVVIAAEAEHNDARVNINGYNYLQEGSNDATVTVTAVDGSTRVYIIHIIKEPEVNSYIRNITVSTGVFWDLTPKFQPTTFEYTTTITHLYDKAKIEAVPVDPATLIDGMGEYELKTGSNVITLTATASNGAVSVYTINVVKLTNNNVNLANLIVTEGDISPTFEKGTTKYSVSVPEDVDKLSILAIPEERTSTVTITGNDNLQSGYNTINIIVMNKSKTASKTYQLTVYKSLSTNSFLSSLKVFDEKHNYPLSPEFYKHEFNYNVVVPTNIEKVSIEATAEKNTSFVVGNGEEYLVYGNNIVQVVVTAEDGSVNCYNVNIYREYDLNLKSLSSDKGELNPIFNENITEYHLNLPNSETEITFEAEKASSDNNVTLTGPGTYKLHSGENEILFTVSDPDGHSKVYKVIVDREEDDNNYIKDLTVNGFISPVFERTTQEYQIDVRKEVTSLELGITLESPTATYTILNNSGFTMGNNPNEVTIRVTAENGATRDYKLDVYLRPDEFFSNRLLVLTVNHGTLMPDFKPDINNYAVTVANSISEITIDVIKEDPYATVTGAGKQKLNLGRNILPVAVTNRNGDVNTYYLTVYRELNSDATLSNLVVKNHTYYPIFNRNTLNYNVSIDGNTDELTIIPTPTDPNSTVTITGNKNLTTGANIITILVTAPDGVTTKTYTITANKEKNSNNYISELSVTDFEFQREYNKTFQGPYIVNVPSDINSIVVNAVPEVSTTTITGAGVIHLNSGQNIINITSTSELGDVRKYTIIANKDKSSDSTLKDILLSDGDLDPEFDSATLEYTVIVPEELETITITGIPNAATSSVSGNGTYDVTDDFTASLVVTSESGSSTTYHINIVRDMSASSKLNSLIVKEGELYPAFHKLVTTYTILVPNEIRSLDMIYTTVDPDATVTVTGNEKFKVGSNTVKITVTAKDGSNSTEYILSVVRQSIAATYLNKLEVEGYPITPKFTKENMYYEVDVPMDTTSANIIATSEDPTATITGTGVKDLDFGENRFYVTVQAQSGVIRSYQVVINRVKSGDNLLLTLESDKGIFDQAFDPSINEYTLTLPPKTDKITLSGTISPTATVIGLGEVPINSSEFDKTISVTSQNGVVNNYIIHIIKENNNNTNLLSLVPSSGSLNYNNETLEYEMEVEGGVSSIMFTAIPEDPDATVTGTDLTDLEYGDNEIIIIVTAEDGVTTREITINVKRMTELEDIIPSEERVHLDIDEVANVTYTLVPEDTSYPEVEWISKDETIAIVDQDGNITGVGLGSTEVQIVSKNDPSIFGTIIVHVINKKILSDVYTIDRSDGTEESDIEVDHVWGAEPKTSIEDFKNNFINSPDTLFMYDNNGDEITDKTKNTATFMTIKLIIEDIVYDELTVVVKGDINGDGLVLTSDYTLIQNSLLKRSTFDYIQIKAADLNNDNKILTSDYTILQNYLLKRITALN